MVTIYVTRLLLIIYTYIQLGLVFKIGELIESNPGPKATSKGSDEPTTVMNIFNFLELVQALNNIPEVSVIFL